ncbi:MULTISPECIES: DUF3830 family protein [unclassified Cryobacterium]|jgi:hypothetical protein|uniref:DUF3830 family protein n=1 Tax=unclassified Cryobacterium TaxID=2649013 RepID=UPI001444A35E|nr:MULTISPECIES: DUF3830 family protein [unclassified Cryobacterium]
MSDVRQFFLEYENGPRAIADLHFDLAPQTCETLWKAFEKPATMDAMHAIYAGPEVMVGLPETHHTFDPEAVPAENQQVIPGVGDLQWYYQRPYQMGGLPFEYWEIGVFYAPGARTLGPLGWTPVNIFATISEGLKEFAKESYDIRINGIKKLTIGRV